MLHVHRLLDWLICSWFTLLPVLVEVVEAIVHTFLIHWHTLLKYVQGSGDDVKLSDHFLECESQFFARSGDAATWHSSGELLVSIGGFVHTSNQVHVLFLSTHGGWGSSHLTLVYTLLRRHFTLNSSLNFLAARWRTTRTLGTMWSWSGCLRIRGCSRTWIRSCWCLDPGCLVKHFSFDLIQVALPNHDYCIGTRRCEKVSTWGEIASCCSSFMSIQTVENMALAQIPNFDSWIASSREQVPAIGMEGNLVDRIVSSIVVLDQSLTSDVPNFDWVVLRTTSNTGAIWMESDRIYTLIMILESIDACLRCDIPQFHSLIFGCWGDQSWIRREFSSQYPVVVSSNREHELSITELEDFEHSVVRTWKKKWSIMVQRDCLNRRWVRFDHLGKAFNWVIPYSHSLISWTWYNLLAIRGYCNSVDRPFMTDEPEWTHCRLEVPHHDRAVERTTDCLLEVRVEHCWHHTIFVAFKRSLESWIGHVSWCLNNIARECLIALHFDFKSELMILHFILS